MVSQIDGTVADSGSVAVGVPIVIIIREQFLTHQHTVTVRLVAEAVGGIEVDGGAPSAMLLVCCDLLIQFADYILRTLLGIIGLFLR